VKESPFQAIESPVVATRAGTRSQPGAAVRAVTRASATVIAAPTILRGRRREPSLSDQRPTPIRKTAATTCPAASTPAAEPADQPRWSTRKSTRKLIVAIWAIR
jgi:hypothetical protein